ncbi:IS607 family transposase [Parafrankia sp. BMG5.11]|uniref:IS607 family transposase n=1 Tax=Parafrankia sp. BMG5.11 TaxID=222540 RepID=UPI00103D2913|nr:IS607 family transposase [Parafrankia sp. BMG5.11]TCJ35328.1 IS607 family transposase [Parafrankia sp. BMG5.11]
MNLKEWAESQGIASVTARRWFNAGKLPVPARKVGGLIIVGDVDRTPSPGETVVYARVSSADQKPGLDRQVAQVTTWATGEGLPVDRVVTEVGSGLNGHRRKFLALLRHLRAVTIIVERRDRFAGVGAEYVEAAFAMSGRRLLVIDPAKVDDGCVRDITGIVTSVCARLYGRRTAGNRARRAVEAAAGAAG